MAFIILKSNPMVQQTVIVNDSEGIPMEWDSRQEAESMAQLFQANSNHNCTYKVVGIAEPLND
jgi:hypothetical protein